MARTAIATGALLILLSLGFAFVGGQFHPTAMIPGFIGLLILVCGLVARNESKRKHAMHAAAMLGVIGVLGSLRGAPKWGALVSGQPMESNAPLQQLLLFIICGVFVILCVQSFIAARKARAV